MSERNSNLKLGDRVSGWFRILKTDIWVKPYILKYKWTLSLAIILGILTFISGGALMFTSGYLISKSATKPENILLIYIPIVLTRAFGIARPVFRYIERLVSHNWVLKMTSDLRAKMYKVIENQSTSFKSSYQSGEVLGLLNEDIQHIQNLYLRSFFPTAVAWGLSFVLFFAMGFVDWKMAIFLLLFLLLMLIGFPIWAIVSSASSQLIQKKWRQRFYTQLTDNVLGVGDWVFSQRGYEYVSHYETEELKLRTVDEKIAKTERQISFWLHFSAGVFAVILLIWSSFHFGGKGFAEANWIAAFVLMIFPLIDAFAPLPSAAEEMENHVASLERLNELSNSIKDDDYISNIQLQDFNLSISDLNYRYSEADSRILSDLSLYIPEKQKLAILGKSGSGKSTLLNLIHGDLVPTNGSILLGGYKTMDIGASISNLIGSLDQSPYLFNTTVANNVRIGNEASSDEEVFEALNKVGLGELVSSLPNGLDTNIDESGLRFSGGERHRLAIARLLLQDAPIILLDEPAIALDPKTEHQLLNMIFNFFSDRTIIWVTHHLQDIEKVDRVIFLEDELKLMDGSPNDLYQNNSKFRQLYDMENEFTF